MKWNRRAKHNVEQRGQCMLAMTYKKEYFNKFRIYFFEGNRF